MNLNETVRAHPVPQNKKCVFIFDGYNAPKEINLTSFGKQEITFGRDAGNDIALTSHLASRHHGAFVLENEQWFIVDKGSTNGIIHNGREEAKVALGEDDFIRIDDGVETVADGVLFIFASDKYSDTWETILSDQLGLKYNLNLISPNIDAFIEHSSNLFYLNVQSSDVSINKKTVFGRVILHEKDVIACKDIRAVFTSTALYVNRLKSNAGADSMPDIHVESVINNISEENATEDYVDENYEDSTPNFNQENSPIVNKQASYNKDYAKESLYNESIQQDVQYDNNYQNSYQDNGSSTTPNSGGLRSFLASNMGYYVLSLVIAIIIWGIAVALWASQGELAIIVILACAVFGWQALNSIQPAMFIWMSWAGWIIYFCIKFILSAIIGLFVAPFKIGKWIAGAISESMM